MQVTQAPNVRPRAGVSSSLPVSNPGAIDQVSTGSVEAVGVMKPLPGVKSGWSEESLNQGAQDFVKSQTGEDSLFGHLDGANCGLSAYVLSDDKAKAVLQGAKELYPGSSEFQKATFNPEQQRMIGVVVSEDEPKFFVCLQERKDGSCKVIDEIGFVGGMCSDSLSASTQEALVPAASNKDREDDWEFLTGAVAGSKPLELGDEAASPFWWQS